MKLKQFVFSQQEPNGWQPLLPQGNEFPANLVLIFAATDLLKKETFYKERKAAFPGAILFGCSTAGEISGVHVMDDSVAVTAVNFDSTTIDIAKINIDEVEDSFEAGVKLTQLINKDGLKHLFVLSDGQKVNGSRLVEGLRENLPAAVSLTGGLSGDGPRFSETLVIGDCEPESGAIAALGFYGDTIKIGYGSVGGWDPFGPERLITRSDNNVLFEMDGKSALELYKSYLGEHAEGLPATGLLFPLSLRLNEGETGVVRTVLAVDEKEKSMTFAGNLPEGAYVRLMKANFDRLIDGAVDAAAVTQTGLDSAAPQLAILISCVGRKMVLKQRVEEEVEGVSETLGEKTILTGFYSYGEICPFSHGSKCELHNQTMTITSFLE